MPAAGHRRFLTLDVFTDRAYGGNPLAVFPDAEGLDGRQMQTIAAELNLSETVFVLPPTDPANTAKIRIFTPTCELPFAGHPTVGTAVALALDGRITAPGEIRLEEAAGVVSVLVRPASGSRPASATFTAPSLAHIGPAPAPIEELAAVVGLRGRDVREGVLAPAAATGDVSFTILPLASSEAVARARLDRNAWERTLSGCEAPQLYVVAVSGGEVHARMFAPLLGLEEDAATGAAAVALGGWLAARWNLPEGVHHWTIRQGAEMGRPSLIELRVDVVDQHRIAVHVGGGAVPIAEGTLVEPRR